jgi:CDP-6-deoxy-D-xylo-4-hexulose-3-dehydrase
VDHLLEVARKEKLREFLLTFSDDKNFLKSVYNKDLDSFDPKTDRVYYSGPYWTEEEFIAAVDSLLFGKWLSSGEKTRKFEVKFCRKFNQRDAVAVNSGSSANLVMLAAVKKLLSWEDDGEIILSVVGFPTTLAPIIQNRLKPIFCDIELDTLNFELDEVEKVITSNTKAIILSPVLGNTVDMDRLVSICDKNNIVLLLDNCDSLGSKWNGKLLSEYALASSHSFYPAHHISTGEGGLVSSNNRKLISLARSFAWWGRDCYCVGAANLLPEGTCCNRFDTWLKDYDGIVDHKYVFSNVGYNLKPLDLQGAIGLVQLDKVDEIEKRRRRSKEAIQKSFLKYVEGILIPQELPSASTSWFGTPVICQDKTQKNKLVSFLEKNRIQTRNYFAGNILLHPGYSHLDDYKKYPNANEVLDTVFFVGASPHYDTKVFNYFEEILRDGWQN